jgi:hypothetical protein
MVTETTLTCPQTQAFAAQVLLDRGWGRPATMVVAESGKGPARIEITRVDEFYP